MDFVGTSHITDGVSYRLVGVTAHIFFGKILKPVVQYLRSHGVRLVLYVDDFLILGQSEEIENNLKFVITTLKNLAWTINYKKSQLTPSYQKNFIGYEVNSKDEPSLMVPKENIKKLQKDIKRALAKSTIQARVLARLAGLCISVVRAIGPGNLMLRCVYRLLGTKNIDMIILFSQLTQSVT